MAPRPMTSGHTRVVVSHRPFPRRCLHSAPMGLQLVDPRAGQPAMETEDDFGRGLDRVDLQHGFNLRDLLSHVLCSQRLPWRALEKTAGSPVAHRLLAPDIGTLRKNGR